MTLNKFKNDGFKNTSEATQYAHLIVKRTEGAKIFSADVNNAKTAPAMAFVTA